MVSGSTNNAMCNFFSIKVIQKPLLYYFEITILVPKVMSLVLIEIKMLTTTRDIFRLSCCLKNKSA